MDAIVLAEVALEVADYHVDADSTIPRAEWRWQVVEKAIEIIRALNITRETDDIDELVQYYLSEENIV
jgi:hypothetical protein